MDRISKSLRSWNMSRIRSEDTNPEIVVRKFLYGQGYRYRVHYHVQGKPDIVFPSHRIALFINGCFWHRHGCTLSAIPKTNTQFWQKKLSDNTKRDKNNLNALKELGWHVRVVWECDIEKRFGGTTRKLLKYINCHQKNRNE